MSEPIEAPQILLQNLSVFNILRISNAPELTSTDVRFGDLIALRGIDVPESASVGETLEIGLVWEALTNVQQDYTLLVHIEDEDGELVAQGDTQAITGLLTSNWAENYALYDRISVTMPEDEGLYHVYIGFYDANSRLMTDAPDGRYQLASISVNR